MQEKPSNNDLDSKDLQENGKIYSGEHQEFEKTKLNIQFNENDTDEDLFLGFYYIIPDQIGCQDI